MTNALGLVEIKGWSPAMVALDAMTKSASVRLLQVELNDLYGACIKVTGETGNVQAAVAAGRAVADEMRVECVTDVIMSPDAGSRAAYDARPEVSPLIEQDVVHIPRTSPERPMSETAPFAIGMIETQGLTAVIEAIDTACKAGNVEILGREKLGGGYITVLIRGDVAAVKAAIEAGRGKDRIERLGETDRRPRHPAAEPASSKSAARAVTRAQQVITWLAIDFIITTCLDEPYIDPFAGENAWLLQPVAPCCMLSLPPRPDPFQAYQT
jgi:microcompartment protein CcmL/EutN